MFARGFLTIHLRYTGGFASSVLKHATAFSLHCSTSPDASRLYGTFSEKPRLDFGQITKIDDAFDLFDEMLAMRTRPCEKDFTKLMSVVVKMKRYVDALFMFDEMRQVGRPVNEYHLTVVINCCCRLHKVNHGFSVLGIMFKLGCKPNVCTFSTLLKGLFLTNKVSEAEEFFKKLLREKICEPNEVMLSTVLDGFCKAGLALTALEMLKLLEKTSWKLNAISYNTIICFNILVASFCKEGMVKEAQDVVDIMSQKGIRPDIITYNALIDGYCLRGKMGKARKTFDYALDSGLKPSIVTYCSLMNGYCKKGNIDETWHLFHEIPRKGLGHTNVSYNIMLHGLFRGGRYADGLNLFEDMQARQLSPNVITLNVMLKGLFRTKHVDQALSLLCTMEEKGIIPDIITYNIVLDGLCKNGKLEIARDIFEKIPSLGLQPDVCTYNIFIGALSREGLVNEAKELLEKMEERDNCFPDNVTYNIFLEGLLKMNNFDEASLFLEEMNSDRFSVDSSTLSMLIDCQNGEAQACRLLKKIKKYLSANIMKDL